MHKKKKRKKSTVLILRKQCDGRTELNSKEPLGKPGVQKNTQRKSIWNNDDSPFYFLNHLGVYIVLEDGITKAQMCWRFGIFQVMIHLVISLHFLVVVKDQYQISLLIFTEFEQIN